MELHLHGFLGAFGLADRHDPKSFRGLTTVLLLLIRCCSTRVPTSGPHFSIRAKRTRLLLCNCLKPQPPRPRLLHACLVVPESVLGCVARMFFRFLPAPFCSVPLLPRPPRASPPHSIYLPESPLPQLPAAGRLARSHRLRIRRLAASSQPHLPGAHAPVMSQ